ncbi:MAG: ubiquinol-cytochrome C chaperone family protein [Proteobacteria bacterium]|nr:ubiquinol-cytochrome C chaperone family protein [Pseudomonadota bacterium]
MLAFSLIARKLRRLFMLGDQEIAANGLYNALVARARSPEFYAVALVPDTIDGRFDMITLHAFLLMHRLKDNGPEAAGVSQALFDEMFRDMDRSLREMGVGDMGVGKRVRAMGKAFMGRIQAYDDAIKDSQGAFDAAIHRNLYRGSDSTEAGVAMIAGYVRDQMTVLADQPLDALVKGRVLFGDASKVTA